MDYSFHSRILSADAHSKHILITLVIDSQNLRKFYRNLNEMKTGHRIENPIVYQKKNMEFQQDKHFEASEFHIMGWGYYK